MRPATVAGLETQPGDRGAPEPATRDELGRSGVIPTAREPREATEMAHVWW
jgi:hypothetical protein